MLEITKQEFPIEFQLKAIKQNKSIHQQFYKQEDNVNNFYFILHSF